MMALIADMVNSRINEVDILGVRYDNLSRLEVLDHIEALVRRRQGNHIICTSNADHVVRAQRDREFRQIMDCAHLVVPDGMAVIYASRILGTPLKQNVGGRLLLPGIAGRSAAKGYRLFLLGGSNGYVGLEASDRLRQQFGGVEIAGVYSPPFMPEFDETETDRMLYEINRARTDILFVCLGTPKQEKWIARNLSRIEASVSIGIGVALDMLAGNVLEPPQWMTAVGLEWSYRLMQEPRRLGKRYLRDDPVFFWWVLKQRLRRNRGRQQ